jgi:hypothetical protein
LNGNLVHAPTLHHTQKVAVANCQPALVRLFKDLKKHDHHQTDDQPEGKVLIKWVQLNKTSYKLEEHFEINHLLL